MKKFLAATAALLSLAFAACDRQVAAADAGPLTDEDRAAIFGTLKLSADAKGRVMNECGELVTPQILPAELGGGGAVLFAISGGPTTAGCYGDGPDLHLLMREAKGWREVYSARGRMLVILPTYTGGMRDIASNATVSGGGVCASQQFSA